MKKTAIQQLIEKLEDIKKNNCKHVYEVVFFDGVLAVIEAEGFLEIEKQQIIDTYNYAERQIYHHIDSAKEYYDETFKNE